MLKIRSLTLLPRVHVGELGLDVLFWESFSERSMISPGSAWRSLTHLMESKTSQLCWLSSVLINKHPSPSIQTISLQSSRSLCLVNLHNTLLYNNKDIYLYILYIGSLDRAQWILSSVGWIWQKNTLESVSLYPSYWSHEVSVSSAYNLVAIQ